MHAATEADLTDSMKMFRWGIEGGRPAPGSIGTAPEWFYKGTGTVLRGHGEALEVPAYAGDGGEEAEIAGIYLIAADGQPHRIGMASGQRIFRSRIREDELPQPGGVQASHLRARSGTGGGPGLRVRAGRGEDRTRRQPALVESLPQRRSRDVSQPGEHRAPSFQI